MQLYFNPTRRSMEDLNFVCKWKTTNISNLSQPQVFQIKDDLFFLTSTLFWKEDNHKQMQVHNKLRFSHLYFVPQCKTKFPHFSTHFSNNRLTNRPGMVEPTFVARAEPSKISLNFDLIQIWYCLSRAYPMTLNLILVESSHKLNFCKP